MALISLWTSHSLPKIDCENNIFRHTNNAKNPTTWFDIKIPQGRYVFDEIIEIMNEKLKENNHFDGIKLIKNEKTERTEIIIKEGFKVDFSFPNYIYPVLGFKPLHYEEGHHESKEVVEILSANVIFVENSLITGNNSMNGKPKDDLIY